MSNLFFFIHLFLRSQYKGAPVCVPQDFVCDGVVDCPEAEDEAESVCWAIKTSADRDP